MQGFQKVVGHQEIITHLQNAISMNKVSHAYLFGGESGSGKKMMASLFAMTLQCEKHGVEPCMECPSCKKAQSQNHPDIIYVKHEKPNTISIDEIREQLINDVMIKPYSSPYKIYIIDEAQKLTLQAQNALLKTIEEPPVDDYFDIFSLWFRDVLLFKATKEVDSLVFKQELNGIRERANKSSYEGLEKIIEAIQKARARLNANVNFDLTMELMFLTMKEN